MARLDQRFARKLLEGGKTSAAGMDMEFGPDGVNEQILLETCLPDAGIELCIFGLRRRCFAYVFPLII